MYALPLKPNTLQLPLNFLSPWQVGSTAFPAATFTVGFTSAADGKVRISLGGTQTKLLEEGRYVYDVIVSSGNTFYRLVDGNILVQPGISSISAL